MDPKMGGGSGSTVSGGGDSATQVKQEQEQ